MSLISFKHRARVFSSQEGKVCHREGVRPVVVRRVPVAPAHHQHEPRQRLARYPEPESRSYSSLKMGFMVGHRLRDSTYIGRNLGPIF